MAACSPLARSYFAWRLLRKTSKIASFDHILTKAIKQQPSSGTLHEASLAQHRSTAGPGVRHHAGVVVTVGPA